MMSYYCSSTKMEVNFVCLDPDTSLPRMLTMITRGSTYKNYQTFYSRTNKFYALIINKICKQASPEKFRYLPAIRNVKSCSGLFPHSSTPGRGSNKTLKHTTMVILISNTNKKYSKFIVQRMFTCQENLVQRLRQRVLGDVGHNRLPHLLYVHRSDHV